MSSPGAKLLPCLMLLACDGPAQQAPPPRGGAVTVAGEPIDAALVLEVASARGLGVVEAARAVARDGVLASAVEGWDPQRAAHLKRVALARALSEQLVERSRQSGPPTHEELERFTERHWWDLDRPPLSRITHALVQVQDEADRARARRVAERLRDALRGVEDAKRFREIAEAHDGEGLSVKVEDLSPVAEDGRAVDPAAPPPPGARVSRYAEPFAKAAAAIAAVGDQSGLVETKFGWHILLLNERLPERRRSREERAELLFPEIVSARARAAERAIIERGKAETSPEMDPAALAQMEGFSGVR